MLKNTKKSYAFAREEEIEMDSVKKRNIKRSTKDDKNHKTKKKTNMKDKK